jgi:hypothetical protein
MQSFRPSIRRLAVAGVAVLVLGAAAVGIAAAQTQPSTPTAQQTAYQKFIGALAQRLGISTQTLQNDISQARQDAGLPAGNGFPGPRGRGGPVGFGPGLELNAAATAIGISPQQLWTELRGKSLTDVANAHNKNPNDVASALKNAAHMRIDQAVTAGRLTADQGNTQKTQADQRIDQLMTRVMPRGLPGGPRGFGGGFGPGIMRQGLGVAAQAIGISTQQLEQEIQGKSLADVANAHNKNPNDVATALKNAAHMRIDQAVTAGRLTADQGNTEKTQIDQRIDQLMNQTVPQRPNRGPGAELDDSGA